MHRIELGARLVEERKRLGYNQTDFGRVGGVSKGSQILYEKGDGAPNGDYLSAIALAGVDVQYVLTGMRSSCAMTPAERVLIERFRACPPALQDAAMRVLLGEETSPGQQIFHGDVGQVIKGGVDQTGLHLSVGSRKKK
ncbi:hypothetical protein DFO50_10272 [Microvirgula sp. AG722]|uniref:XRE family transcriptional regulator n=1 Tax=Microvirgula sp. AG722 TaxID=2183901 RepID=UPI000DC23708|nr:XRE family transcriptional regulator [Microvirgula sp. AG722]RAS18916.1 hypothetical protein DFO50_10272 [Microvirgula sp. AG722]